VIKMGGAHAFFRFFYFIFILLVGAVAGMVQGCCLAFGFGLGRFFGVFFCNCKHFSFMVLYSNLLGSSFSMGFFFLVSTIFTFSFSFARQYSGRTDGTGRGREEGFGKAGK